MPAVEESLTANMETSKRDVLGRPFVLLSLCFLCVQYAWYYRASCQVDSVNLGMETSRINDILFQSPIPIRIGRTEYSIAPVTFGMLRVLSEYPFFQEEGPLEQRLVMLCAEDFEQACSILACLTLGKKSSDRRLVAERASRLNSKCERADLPIILHMVLNDDTAELMRHYGIEKDIEKKGKVSEVKKSENNLSFGCRSPWGSILDAACSRYHWSVEYVLWGISSANLTMMMSDAGGTVYLGDDELKKLNNKVLKADDPANADEILRKFRK